MTHELHQSLYGPLPYDPFVSSRRELSRRDSEGRPVVATLRIHPEHVARSIAACTERKQLALVDEIHKSIRRKRCEEMLG